MSKSLVARCDGEPGEFFTWAELRRNGRGIDNPIPTSARINLTELVQHFLDPIRRYLGEPVIVTSGFRSVALNTAVGGSKTSAHMTGEAVDIKVGGMTSGALLMAFDNFGIRDYDQLIAYAPSRGGHLHLGIKAGAAPRARREKLWARSGGGYEPFNFAKHALSTS